MNDVWFNYLMSKNKNKNKNKNKTNKNKEEGEGERERERNKVKVQKESLTHAETDSNENISHVIVKQPMPKDQKNNCTDETISCISNIEKYNIA